MSIFAVYRAGLLRPGAVGVIATEQRWLVDPDGRHDVEGAAVHVTLSGYLPRAAIAGDLIEAHFVVDGVRCAAWLLVCWTHAFRGRRPMWRCTTCGERALRVYWTGAAFGCRRCLGLAYSSQLERPRQRATRRARSLRARLRWFPWVTIPEKPPGMHWCTFARLAQSVLSAERVAAVARIRGLRSRSLRELPFAAQPLGNRPSAEDVARWRSWCREAERQRRRELRDLHRAAA